VKIGTESKRIEHPGKQIVEEVQNTVQESRYYLRH
jgi:hypothetical protein